MANKNLLVLVLLCAMVAASAATTFYAGGSGGWTLENVNNIVPLNMKILNELKFGAFNDKFEVARVSSDAFDNCDDSAAFATLFSGSDTVSFPTEGEFYFIDSNKSNCEAGMKMSVSVGQ